MAEFTKKLGLNLIVGSGEADILERCLKSVQGINFDEVVVTHATRMPDEKVLEVANRYATKVAQFEWCDDFSKARNYSFSQSEAGHILWLDSDDVVKQSEHAKINALIEKLPELDIVLMDYVYSHDDKDRPVLVLPRERLVRNTDKIKWHDPIHEYLNMDGSMRISRLDIKIDHYRNRPYDPKRNLTLLKQEYDTGEASARIAFYYGKELADVGNWEEAVPVLEKFVAKGEGFVDNLTVGCIRLANYYMRKKDKESASNYAMLGIRFNGIYAENHVILGIIAEEEGREDEAVTYFKEALTKTLSGGMSQLVDYYGYIPSMKLATIMLRRRKLSEALKHVDHAISKKPESKEAHALKAAIEEEARKGAEGETIEPADIDALGNFLRNRDLMVEVLANHGLHADLRLRKHRELSVAWLLPNDDATNPSTRLRRLIVDGKLRQKKVKSTRVVGYQNMGDKEIEAAVGDANVVVFTSFGPKELELMRAMKAQNRKICFDHCEGIFGFPLEDDCMHEADAILCCSTKLEEMTRQRGFLHTVVLKDSVEEREPKKPHQYRGEKGYKPKAVFLGMGGNSFLVTDHLRDTIEGAGYELVVISEWDNADIKWDAATWPDDLVSCDVALCPQRVDVQPGKSSVKATTAMAFGMPVIASPLQAYKEIITHGENGYIAETKEEWGEALQALKDIEARRRVGKAAKKAVAPYRLDNNVQNYIHFFDGLVNGTIRLEHADAPVKEEKARDVVDLIIPNYNNLDYLKLCLSSIRLNTVHPFHIVISDAGSDAETWAYLRTLKGITVLGEEGVRRNFSETCNAGIRSSRSGYFVIMNSDVVVSKGWLGNMVKHMGTVHRLASCGVLSNCDRGWLHGAPGKPDYPMRLEKAGIELHPGMKLEEITPHIDELYEFMEASNKRHKDIFQPQEWVAAYATIFARSAVNEVGLFDTRFKNGCEDLDLCMRLGKAGFACGQSIGSFVFHFGGVSRGAYQDEDRESYDAEDYANHVMLKQKWERKRIAIWTGPAWEPWNRQKVDEGMAGSETWAAYLSRAFVKKGYDVTVYNDLLADSKDDVVEDPVVEGGVSYGAVRYVDHTKMMEDIQYVYIDYLISSRSSEPMRQSLHSGRNYVMVHDIWLNPDPNYDVMAWKVQGYAYLSDWHKEFLLGHHKQMPPEKMFLTSNGVVQELYAGVDDREKECCSVYSSSPDRGLYQLLQMMPEIRKAVPDFKLKVAYGFYNWEEAVKKRNDQRGMAFIQRIKAAMEQPGVEYLDRIDKATLAGHQKRANVWLYPTWFDETFCCLPTNEVYTESGFKSIAEMTLEDKVLTHEGRFMGVHKVMKRPYKGTVHALSCENNSGALSYFTPEHPVLCLKSKDANAIRRQKYGDYKATVLEKESEWINAGDVKVGDYVCFPEYRPNPDVPTEIYDPLPDYRQINRNYRVIRGRIKTRDYNKHRGVPTKFPMTTSFARFLGLYFAEGSFSQGSVWFSFHSDEKDYLEFVRSYAEDALGIPSHVDDSSKDNGANVVVGSHTLGVWLKQQFGHSASLKTVPGFVIQQDESFRKEFVAAAFDGDGHFGENDNKIQLASKRGIMNLRMVMFSLGMRPSLLKPSVVKGRKYYTLSVAKGQWDRCFKGSYDGKEQRTYLEHGGKVFYKVKEILSKKYEGFVYNMEVDGDNSYVSDFLAVHNCIGAVENGLSHNAILTTGRAGINTTVADSGILLPGDGLPMDGDYPKEYTDRFVEEAVRLLTDADYRREWADKARDKMQEYSWDRIADGWIKQFDG